jgi:AraC-like DNA-binding protein/uncharacterized RDD family membrane protein YckC
MASLLPVRLAPAFAERSGLVEDDSPLTPGALMTFIERMRQNPAEEFKTETVAARFNVPAIAFIRAFKRLSGLSPQRFRAALRIEQAKRLLMDTDRPITEVSFDVGYNSLGTFVRTFTMLVGVSPGLFRRLAAGKNLDIPLRPGRSTEDDGYAETRTVWATLLSPPTGRLIAAGLFPQSFPAGVPLDGCFVDPAAPAFRLDWPRGQNRASLLIAAIGDFSLEAAWAGRLTDVQVCGVRLASACTQGVSPIPLRLRPLALSDPPFLTPVPLLMLLQSRRSRLRADHVMNGTA